MEDFIGEEQEKVLIVDLVRDLAVLGHVVDDGDLRFAVRRR